ncbi:MAG TPA: thioredoxin family protein [Roseiflexaceae bacterium]|nr:thioredoxin family protein [Roseiflexaceae bacterium]
MLDRIIILALIVVAATLGWAALRAWRAAKLRRLGGEAPFAGVVPGGRPAVVAFSTPTCAECRTRQAPALDRLAAAMGESVAVAHLSALDHPDLVERIGILTVPATVVLDAQGAVRQVNLGFADEWRLAEQVRGLGKQYNREGPRKGAALS